MDLQTQNEIAEMRKEVAEMKSELTLALSKISDNLSTHSENYRELRTTLDRLCKEYSLEEEQNDAEVQHEPDNRDTTADSAD